MRLTTRQLRQIIAEEIQRYMLNEGSPWGPSPTAEDFANGKWLNMPIATSSERGQEDTDPSGEELPSKPRKLAYTESGGYRVDGKLIYVDDVDDQGGKGFVPPGHSKGLTPLRAVEYLEDLGVTHIQDEDADGATYAIHDWFNKIEDWLSDNPLR